MSVPEKSKEGKKAESTTNRYSIYFLAVVGFLYLMLFIFEPAKTAEALKASGALLISILPVLLLVIFFMGIMNYLLNPKQVKRHVGEGSGLKGWTLAISTGILSHGPIYVWYPLLRDLQRHGMRNGLIATFLYNRGIKLPWLPVMIYYFGLAFVLVLLVAMIIASIAEGKLIDMLEASYGKMRDGDGSDANHPAI